MRLDSAQLNHLFSVIHEDAGLLVVHKPADLVCHPTKGDEFSSLISRARIYLRQHGAGATPHLIHRLDRETSGVVVFAKNPGAARELGKIWETRAVQKEYLAIVHGHVAQEHGIIDAPLGRDETSRVAIKNCVRAGGAAAQTEFFVEKKFTRQIGEANSPFTLLRANPLTGRKHQIRIHLAHFGHPIVGDKLYGGNPDCYLALVEGRLTEEQRASLMLSCHALHARRIQFVWRGKDCEFISPPERAFSEFMG